MMYCYKDPGSGAPALVMDNVFDSEQLKKMREEIIKTVGASSMKDMGKIMGALKSKHSDSLDFSKVNSILKGLLN